MPGIPAQKIERFLHLWNQWNRSIFFFTHYPAQNRFALLLEMLKSAQHMLLGLLLTLQCDITNGK